MFVYISVALLAVSCVLLAWVARSLRRDLEQLHNKLLADSLRLRQDFFDNDIDLDRRITELKRTFAAAEDLIKEHAELEKEAANSEKLFQEGLANILSYGVVKNE